MEACPRQRTADSPTDRLSGRRGGQIKGYRPPAGGRGGEGVDQGYRPPVGEEGRGQIKGYRYRLSAGGGVRSGGTGCLPRGGEGGRPGGTGRLPVEEEGRGADQGVQAVCRRTEETCRSRMGYTGYSRDGLSYRKV